MKIPRVIKILFDCQGGVAPLADPPPPAGGEKTKMPLDPLVALGLTNWGGEKPPMSIEAVIHAEDADNRVYDSVGTLLSKPRKSVVAQR